MTRPAEKTGSSARTQIRPPPFSQHLREFASNPHAWAVLARNLIPVVGIYGFGWSAGLIVFNYWFDGLTALAAITAALVPRAMRETRTKNEGTGAMSQVRGRITEVFRGVLTWIFLVGIIGLPYWIVLVPLHTLFVGENLRQHLAQSPGLWFAFGSIAVGHFWKAFQSGYDTMPDNQLKQRLRSAIYLLMLRGIAMFMMIGFAIFIVPLMALLLSYFEIWPERVIGAVFGDPSRLYEYDPEKEK
ncbi:MAG TPA: DUF6498-containing protein [Chthoniobacterales bacterium]|nr:DUF6498-containing protein [Chthoniobacterales bacterium]